jgi:hypothetical protein
MQIKLLNSVRYIYEATPRMGLWSHEIIPLPTHSLVVLRGNTGEGRVVNSWGAGWPRAGESWGGVPVQQVWPVSEVANAD